MLLTRELDRLIRQAEVAGIRSTIETVQRLYPDLPAEVVEIAGGIAVFTGVDSPFSKAYGIGVMAPVTLDDVARITEFYESRGTAARVFMTPMTDPTLGRALAAAGYAPVEYDNVLVAADINAHARHDDRIGVATDLQAWALASALGFTGRQMPHDETIATIVASSPGVVPLEAHEDGTIVATAALAVRGETAALIAGATVPEYRQRGWHIALIRERIARARESGARILHAAARPASSSERNFHRCGFVTIYTRARWDRLRKGTTLDAAQDMQAEAPT